MPATSISWWNPPFLVSVRSSPDGIRAPKNLPSRGRVNFHESSYFNDGNEESFRHSGRFGCAPSCSQDATRSQSCSNLFLRNTEDEWIEKEFWAYFRHHTELQMDVACANDSRITRETRLRQTADKEREERAELRKEARELSFELHKLTFFAR